MSNSRKLRFGTALIVLAVAARGVEAQEAKKGFSRTSPRRMWRTRSTGRTNGT